jgi:hypothetical protein
VLLTRPLGHMCVASEVTCGSTDCHPNLPLAVLLASLCTGTTKTPEHLQAQIMPHELPAQPKSRACA